VILELTGLNSFYGESHVVQDLNLDVEEGEMVALLGRNGAGKSTTLRSIMRLVRTTGAIRYRGREISQDRTHTVARRGIAYLPSGRRMFSDLTVRQNLMLPAAVAGSTGSWTIERVVDFFPKLGELMDRRAGALSGGEQQMLKLGRGLLSSPNLLLLDEPSEGLAPVIVEQMVERLVSLKSEGLSILICEQNAMMALRISDRAYLLTKGRIVHTAPSLSLIHSPELAEHLGV